MQLLLQPRVTHPARHKMLARVQININDCRVWSFFNEIGALAQCPHNWGVGSAFHPMKIHIYKKASYTWSCPPGGHAYWKLRIETANWYAALGHYYNIALGQHYNIALGQH